jgi:hypothetical protein
MPADCEGPGCGDEEICGNGLDDDCNGETDDGCTGAGGGGTGGDGTGGSGAGTGDGGAAGGGMEMGAAPTEEDEGACGCRLAGQPDRRGRASWLAPLLAIILLRRRRGR